MSAIARILLARGEYVSGSDVKETSLLAQLRAEGARISIGHDARNIDGATTVVLSSAIDRMNPETVAARRAGVAVLHRGELLAQLMRERRGIAICGTHGKTTTTAMAHAVLRGCGIDAGLALGGIDVQLESNACDGTSAWFATEADESDGSFALLDPVIAVVTNIENDHLASDDDLPHLVRAFGEFLKKLPEDGLAIIGIDNAQSASLATAGENAEYSRRARTVTIGLTPQADLHASNIRFADLGSTFDVMAGEIRLGTVGLCVPGEINVQNALAAIAIARELEIPFAKITAALRGFHGVRRRFDIVARSERMIVVDDYAHHPTAVRATIAAARDYAHGPLVVAFQPHRYTRTAYLARDFADALHDADRVYLAPIYAASEPSIPGVSERSIGEPLEAAGIRVSYVNDVDDLERRLYDEVPHGAIVLMLGAGNITDVAQRLAQRILTQSETHPPSAAQRLHA